MISVALKTPLQLRLGICIYKTSLLHRPDDYNDSHQAVPPHFATKLRPSWLVALPFCWTTSQLFLTWTRLVRLNFFFTSGVHYPSLRSSINLHWNSTVSSCVKSILGRALWPSANLSCDYEIWYSRYPAELPKVGVMSYQSLSLTFFELSLQKQIWLLCTLTA